MLQALEVATMAALPGCTAYMDTPNLCKPPLSEVLVKQRESTKQHAPEVPKLTPSCDASNILPGLACIVIL